MTSPALLLIHETLAASGARETVEVGARDGELLVCVDGDPTLLPMRVLDVVMTRYGHPLADGITLDGPSVDLGDGARLHRLRYLEVYDVIAKDYLVWCAPGREPLAELAISVTAALTHFVRAARAAASP